MSGKTCLFVYASLAIIILLTGNAFAQTKPTTSRQIELLIKEKKSRTAVEQKIDSRLLQALKQQQGKKTGNGINAEPVNVNADSKGNLEVDMTADVTDSLINRIKNAGGQIIYPSKQYHTIRAKINLAIVAKIAAYPEVKFIEPAAVAQLQRPVTPRTTPAIPGTDVPAITAPVSTPDDMASFNRS